ncbi:tyrosine-type recombinase/integrase [Sphingobacterium spiritivorum]|uniref:site-specific integrase n=1 Tax=Sphingobacterium spiritivorum TaxID=258 RepID=UPI003DA238F7
MFKYKSKLFYHKTNVGKDGMVSLYIEVYISYKGGYDRDRFPLNLRWPPDKINLESSSLIQRERNDIDVGDYNMIILDERAKMNEIAKRFRLANRMLSIEVLARELHYLDATNSLVAFMRLRRKERYKNKEISEQTYKNQLSTINAIIEYQPITTFAEIDKQWMQKFKADLKNKGNKHNTIWTRIRDIKSNLTAAKEEHNIYVDQNAVDFTNKPVKEEAVYLLKEEVIRLINLLDKEVLTPTQYNVLKAFLFCCFTGVRISDLYKSKYNWFISENFLKFTMVKNGENKPKTLTIPLIPIAKALIDNLKGLFFDLPTSQEYNRTIKDLAKMAGIRKKLTSHTARHTFGHLFMTIVGNIFALKQLLGHSKIETTEGYAHVDDLYNFNSTVLIQEAFMHNTKLKRLKA